jgi:hypothetical protein
MLTESPYGLLSPANNSGIIGKVWGLKNVHIFQTAAVDMGI